ncbi:lipid A deacylase LpxR family protein [uncultured Desulfuromonas sp.]|uniref:lipid A deacylase LpxR family protein n=1 Tax=uncultured Desulfuromonas sp. TaxID=181013 RepID=UPI002AABA320|nr:lipid A deacylase LpxR family protein [uncultured Desulfuromonas sp.]
MPGHRFLVGVVLCFSVLMGVAPVAAQDDTASLWSLGIANDSFFNQDRGYTSGWDIAFTPQASPFTVRLGQDIYTPDRDNSEMPPPGQHPYAAWLYARGDYRYQLCPVVLMTTSVSFGTTGERALGEEFQDVAHQVLGFDDYEGWDSQISERWGWIVGVELLWQQPLVRTPSGYGLDLITMLEGQGGNILVDLSAGVGVRFGYQLPELSATPEPNAPKSVYFTLYGERKIVDKNVFLEGVSSSDYRVEPERGVNTLSCGVHWREGAYQVDLDFYFPEQEFKDQDLTYRYGVLRLSYWY